MTENQYHKEYRIPRICSAKYLQEKRFEYDAWTQMQDFENVEKRARLAATFDWNSPKIHEFTGKRID